MWIVIWIGVSALFWLISDSYAATNAYFGYLIGSLVTAWLHTRAQQKKEQKRATGTPGSPYFKKEKEFY